MGGTATFDGKFCRGPTREQCVGKTGKCDEGSLCAKIPGGTSWDEDAGACVLNDAKAAKDAERLRWVIGGMTVGLVLTILTGGEVDWVIADIAAGVLLEDAFKEIDRFNETRPNQLATDYINDAKTCGLIDGDDKKTCIDKQCIINLVKKYYASIYDVIGSNATALNDTQLEIFEKVNGRINGCLTDSELKSAMKKSIRLPKDIITEQASVVLMGLGFFACPSNFISKIKNLTNTYRLFSRAGFTHIESATEVINGMRYNRLYLDGLNSSQTKNLERALTGKNLSFSRKTSEGRQFLEFYDRNVSNIVNIEHTATGIKVGKWNFETATDNSLGVRYYERLFDDSPKDLANNLYDDFGTPVAVFKRDDKYVLAVFDNTDDLAKAQKVLGQRNLLMDIPLTEDQISNVLKDIYEESKVGNKIDLEILIPKLRNAGFYNEKNAARMADDLANEAAQRIRFFDANHETGIVDRLKRYYSLTEEEKVGLLMDLQDIIGHIRRDPTGKTQIGCVFSQRVSSVSGFGTPDRPFEFKYGIKNGSAEDMVDDIFHENTHAYQRQGKSSLSKQVVDFNLENYAPPEMDYDLYLQNIIEAEAWDVGSRAARRLFIILGL